VPVVVVVVEVLSSEGMAQFVEFNSRSANGLKNKKYKYKTIRLKVYYSCCGYLIYIREMLQ
jgi:hypothetical protein